MSRFIETIRIQDGHICRLAGHQARLEKTQLDQFGEVTIELSEVLHVPMGFEKGRIKCRVLYDQKLQSIEFYHYNIKPVSSLQIVTSDINYHFKSEDRSALSKLYKKRNEADDILIVKDEMITDAYYANVAFLSDNKWYTSDTPLLEGVMRATLIAQGELTPRKVTIGDLQYFEKVALINAMINLGEVVIDTADVIPPLAHQQINKLKHQHIIK